MNLSKQHSPSLVQQNFFLSRFATVLYGPLDVAVYNKSGFENKQKVRAEQTGILQKNAIFCSKINPYLTV